MLNLNYGDKVYYRDVDYGKHVVIMCDYKAEKVLLYQNGERFWCSFSDLIL